MESATVEKVDIEIDEQVQHIQGVIESLLFVNEKPVTMDQIKKVLDTVGGPEIKKAIKGLQKNYEERKSGMMLIEIAGGYQILSNPIYAQYLRNFYKTKHKDKLSKPALESMAIIAYKQPVTRSDIEMIRGVNSDGVVSHLLNKELIKIVGRKDVPGRPFVYGTTKQFMEYFGLKSLDDLPALEEFPTLEPSEDGIIPVDEDGNSVSEEDNDNDSEKAISESNEDNGEVVDEIKNEQTQENGEAISSETVEENKEQGNEHESEKST